jgi:hypothetical protein
LTESDGRRIWSNGELTSTELPALRLRIEPRLRYLGATELEIKGIARADRHHWAGAVDGEVRQLLVVQFEGFLPGNEERYVYRLPDPVELGGRTWGRWTAGYRASLSDAPEVADTATLLAAHGLRIADELLMARYATIVEPEARHEVLLFLHEPAERLGFRLETLVDEEGALRPEHVAVGTELHARARRAVRVLPPEPMGA